MRPLLAELARIRAGSPLLLDAYLLEASLEGYRFFQTRDARDLDRALGLLAQARRLSPDDPLPLVTLFGVALNAGRLDEAEAALRDLERRLPGDVRTLQRRALLSERRGDHGQALELLRAAADRHPSASFLMDLANLEMREGEIPAARSTLEDLLRRVPGHFGGQNLLAGLELKSGSLERAAGLYAGMARRRRFRRRLEPRPRAAPPGPLRRGGREETQAGLAWLRRATPPRSTWATWALLRGRPARAQALYRQVLDLAAADPALGGWQTLAARAQAEAHLGRGPEAAATIQQAVVAALNDPEVAFYAALVHAVIGDTAAAIASADRALAGGFNRRWFSLPWFDALRRDPAFVESLARPPKSRPREVAPAGR